ncbi:Sister chromatid cohesion protein 2 [Microbotryomycetes sp. JL221]|nr:Sister chromatid cohesion protein 2 [Microbotryomycetes sp. JL221]
MDAQQEIDREVQEIVRGYPLVAGLTSIADVVTNLNPPRAARPTLFSQPGSSAPLVDSGFDEPVLNQYAIEIATLLGSPSPSDDAHKAAWRRAQLVKAGQVLDADLVKLQSKGSIGVKLAAPPFPVSNGAPHVVTAPSAPSHHIATEFLAAANYPYPTQKSTSSSASSSLNLATRAAVSEDSSRQMFGDFLATQKAKRQSAASTVQQVTPPRPAAHYANGVARAHAVATSSPDPLHFADRSEPASSSSSSGGTAIGYGKPPLSAYQNQYQHTNGVDSMTPRINGNDSQMHRPLSSSSSSAQGLTESQMARTAFNSTPGVNGSFAPSVGVESAIAKFRLVTPSASVSSSAKGTVKASEVKDVVERCTDAISDLFSAEDSFVSDTSQTHVGVNGQSRASEQYASILDQEKTSEGFAVVRADYLKKLVKLLSAVQLKGKGEALLAEAGESGFLRLLRMVERSWHAAEHVRLWPAEALAAPSVEDEFGVTTNKSTSKGKVKNLPRSSTSPRKRSRSQSREDDEDEDAEELELEAGELHFLASQDSTDTKGVRRSQRSVSRSRSPSTVAMEVDSVKTKPRFWTIELLEHVDTGLETVSDALDAARAALSVLTVASLPKALYSADYILSILSFLRTVLDHVVVPLLEAQAGSHLEFLASARSDAIGQVCDSMCPTTQLVARLVQHQHMSEDIVIAVSYFGLTPFFHEEAAASSSKAKKAAAEANIVKRAIKTIRLASLGLIKTVFATYPTQRDWIVEEVLTSLLKLDIAQKTKGSLRLRNGLTIHAVSALLMHLVQTVPTSICEDVTRSLQTDHQAESLGDDSQMSDAQKRDDEQRREADSLTIASRDIVQPALDSASKTARTIISYLMQKSCKAGKAVSGSTESEYRLAFDNLIADLLNTLHLAEWPGADVLLASCVRSMLGVLADPKTGHEIAALKSIALDHLGQLGARVRQDVVKANNLPALKMCSEMSSLWYRVAFGSELFNTVSSADMIVSTYDQSDFSEEAQRARSIRDQVANLAVSWWSLRDEEDVFGPNLDDLQSSVDNIVLQLSKTSTLVSLYPALLERIVDACESSAVNLRTKAMRAVSLLVSNDPDLFHHPTIRRGIESRMHDSSPAVRDATIELVGKFIVASPELAQKYLPQISSRITDTGLSVRRRVVKLLKALYPVLNNQDQRVEICRKLVWRSLDEDSGIQELANDAIFDLWFARSPASTTNRKRGGTPEPTQEDKQALSDVARIIMSVAGKYQDRAPPIEEVLRFLIEKHEKNSDVILERLQQIIETLVDGLISDENSNDVIACVRTIHALNNADVNLLSPTKAQLLLPFLIGATTTEEQLVCDYLLKIFRSTVSAMPKSASKFGREMQSALMPMLNKPPQNINSLQEVVACFCSVIHSQTKDFASLVSVFRACFARFAAELKKVLNEDTRAGANVRALPLLSYMVSLLCESGHFDELRKTNKDLRPTIDSISKGPVPDQVFGMLARLYELVPPIRSAVLTSLGFIFRARPTLMQDTRATTILDEVFESGQPGAQLQLLRILQDFFASRARVTAQLAESKKKIKASGVRDVRMDELVGNSDVFAESGVPSAISQRYIDQMLAAAKSTHAPLQRTAIDILLSVTHSGFIHPMTLSPTLVALTSCSDGQVSSKAFSALALLHQKHASMLASRFLESALAAHAYALVSAGDQPVRGFHGDPPSSRIGRWYSLLQKEKRQYQLDFLRVLSRVFDVEAATKCSDASLRFTVHDVSFARFLAEALSTLEFKRLEEPMTIIKHLNASLAVGGLQLMHQLQASMGTGGLLGDEAMNDGIASMNPPPANLARQSIVCGLALLLRDYLKHTYTITDAKLAKHTLGKKSVSGDRAPVRRAEAQAALGVDSYTRMPFALVKMDDDAQLVAQRNTYIALIEQDGTINAMDELDDGND